MSRHLFPSSSRCQHHCAVPLSHWRVPISVSLSLEFAGNIEFFHLSDFCQVLFLCRLLRCHCADWILCGSCRPSGGKFSIFILLFKPNKAVLTLPVGFSTFIWTKLTFNSHALIDYLMTTEPVLSRLCELPPVRRRIWAMFKQPRCETSFKSNMLLDFSQECRLQ